jgi:hypothetical protein
MIASISDSVICCCWVIRSATIEAIRPVFLLASMACEVSMVMK